MSAQLRMSFEVECSPEHAFDVFTAGIGTWWPRDHSITGAENLAVVIQSGVGGRIFERTPDGTEHEWGQVTVWEPPTRLVYLWHLARERANATEVDIRFVALGDEATRVEIEHRGWERVADAEVWRDRNRIGWESLLPHYVAALTKGAG